MTAKPAPRVTDINRPFWEGCNAGKLMLQRCRTEGCGQYVYYPRVCCPQCHGGALAWTTASGRGRIVSYTAVHRPQHESFYDAAPILFVVVKLEEGPLMYSRLTGVAEADADLIDRPVQVLFVEHGKGQKLPFFKPT